jgi:uncharacterized protein (TIGR02646 family)
MKYIRKQGAPHEYRTWCRDVRGTDKEEYHEIPRDTKAVILAALVNEQGGLCAYTMKRIDVYSSHIEHIKPEWLCRDERRGSDLAYDNMLSCFPREGMRRSCRYGAQKKDSWWDPALFVSPLHQACEKRFRFNIEGEISVMGKNRAAQKTIEVLALNHPTLTEDRRRAIHEFIFGEKGDDPLSKSQADQLKQGLCSRSNGCFVEFCTAIGDGLEEHLGYLEKMARKRQFSRRAAR